MNLKPQKPQGGKRLSKTINNDFYIHWLWTLSFAVLGLTGLALMGVKYGWILNYNLALADYLHRIMAPVFVVSVAAAIFEEIRRVIYTPSGKATWLIVGENTFQKISLVIALLLIFSGMFLWSCMEYSMKAAAFAMLIHEWTTIIALGTVIWHIYDKAHVITVTDRLKIHKNSR